MPISEITSFEIGYGWYGGYDGLIDDFRIYDYALSKLEIAYIATNGTGIFDKSWTAPADLQSIGRHSSVACMHQKFVLEHIRSEQCMILLSKLGLDQVSPVPNANAVLIFASPELLRRASLVLDIIDVKEEFVIENLGPASAVRNLPSNTQIATTLGDIRIGTFEDPPKLSAQTRGIIDIHADLILAIIPARYRLQLLDMLAQTKTDTMFTRSASTSSEHLESYRSECALELYTDIEVNQPKTKTFVHEVVPAEAHKVPRPGKIHLNTGLGSQIPYQAQQRPNVSGRKAFATNYRYQETTVAVSPRTVEDGTIGSSRSSTFILKPVKKTASSMSPVDKSEVDEFENGEDILEFDLPETMTLIQLLEFVGEYLDLDCVYDPDVVGVAISRSWSL